MKLSRLSAPVLLLFPAFLVLAAVVVVPLALSFYSSFTPFRLTKPESLYVFIGLRNYITVISSWDFWVAFGRTVLFLTIALNAEMLLGLGLALLVSKAVRGQRLLRTLMMFPMMFSPVLVGFQFKFLFNDNIGLINNALQSLGLTDQAIPWLIDGNLALFSITVAEVWSSTLGVRNPHSGRSSRHAARSDRGRPCRWLHPAANFPLCHLALSDAVCLHRHDHPLAGCGESL